LSDPDFVEGPGAESFRGFVSRVDAAADRARQRPESFMVIFAHSLFLRGLLWRAMFGTPHIDAEAMKLYREFSRSFDIPNCGHFRQLIAPDGSVFTDAIQPLDATEPRPTAEQIQLSGL
jgi:broad specificity phosphatase PhoE